MLRALEAATSTLKMVASRMRRSPMRVPSRSATAMTMCAREPMGRRMTPRVCSAADSAASRIPVTCAAVSPPTGPAAGAIKSSSIPPGVSAGTAGGTFLMGPTGSPGPVPEEDLIAPAAGPVGGLTAAQVTGILDAAESAAEQTRGVIRLPIGSRAHMVIAVADLDGTLIGLRRMRDATIFSVDVAASKARNMIYFNSASRVPADMSPLPIGTAVTNRTISFGAMPLYPPGIDGTVPGPFFNLFLYDTAHPCTQGSQPANANQSGIVFFPGSTGLYVGGKLMGGLGLSG